MTRKLLALFRPFCVLGMIWESVRFGISVGLYVDTRLYLAVGGIPEWARLTLFTSVLTVSMLSFCCVTFVLLRFSKQLAQIIRKQF